MARPRMRYALRQLAAEVREVFPFTKTVIGQENGLSVSHSLTFDQEVSEWLKEFSDLLAEDDRIKEITMLDDRLTVAVKDRNASDDDRPFGIVGAADILGFTNPNAAYPQGEEVASGLRDANLTEAPEEPEADTSW